MGLCCNNNCIRSFKEKGVNDALRFANRLYYATLVLLFLQVIVSLIETITDAAYAIPYGKYLF